MSDADNIMGFIPKNQYVKYAYYLLLGAASVGLLLSLFSLMGVHLPFQGLVMVATVLGLVMALLGFFVFKSEFSTFFTCPSSLEFSSS
jgi:predicted tellurium resistance membrane protein TerC